MVWTDELVMVWTDELVIVWTDELVIVWTDELVMVWTDELVTEQTDKIKVIVFNLFYIVIVRKMAMEELVNKIDKMVHNWANLAGFPIYSFVHPIDKMDKWEMNKWISVKPSEKEQGRLADRSI